MSEQIYSVLIVDDESEVRAALARALRFAGWRTQTAIDGQQAMQVLNTANFDVVISDFDMPGMNGLTLLQKVRLTQPGTVRVLLTGRADIQIASRALNEGAAHRFFIKPWSQIDIAGTLALAVRSLGHRVAAPQGA